MIELPFHSQRDLQVLAENVLESGVVVRVPTYPYFWYIKPPNMVDLHTKPW